MKGYQEHVSKLVKKVNVARNIHAGFCRENFEKEKTRMNEDGSKPMFVSMDHRSEK